MIQTCTRYERIDDMVREDYDRTPAKPTVMAEGGYEGVEFGRLQTPLEIRKQAYWLHLAGGHHTYGDNDCWVSPETWREWIDSPGALQMGVYKASVTSCRSWWNWIPDQSVFAEGKGDGPTRNVAARSAGGDWILAYLSGHSPVSVRMDKITAGGTVEAAWIDPTSGSQTRIGTFANAGVRSFSPPDGWQDAVLQLTV